MLSKWYTEYFDLQDEAQILGVKIQNLSDEVDQQKKQIHTLMASCDSLDGLYKDVVGSLTDGISHVVSSSCSFDCCRTAAVAAGQHAAVFLTAQDSSSSSLLTAQQQQPFDCCRTAAVAAGQHAAAVF
jgi:hypothetical protein